MTIKIDSPGQFDDSKIIECINHLEFCVGNHDFTSWSFANEHVMVSAVYEDECNGQHPRFDIASLTKPFFLNALLRLKWGADFSEKITLPLELLFSSNSYLFSLFNELGLKKYTLNDFLSHRTEFDPWTWFGRLYWLESQNSFLDPAQSLNPKEREKMISQFLRELKNKCYGRKKNKYSDLNYFLFALLIDEMDFGCENHLGAHLDFVNQSTDTNYQISYCPVNTQEYVPIASYCVDKIDSNTDKKKEFSHLQVSDSNANILSQYFNGTRIYSGHTGFLGSVEDVLKSTKFFISQWKNNKNRKSTPRTGNFYQGLDISTATQQCSAVKHKNHLDHVFGHLGYSGCSFWFYQNPDKNENPFHILLTNRTAKRVFSPGETKPPRILKITDTKTRADRFYSIQKGVSSPLGQLEKIQAGNQNKRKVLLENAYWDPKNINATRTHVGNLLWEI